MISLTQKIQKAIPSLMELSEGCVLEAKVEKELYYKIAQIKGKIFQVFEIGDTINLLFEKHEIESIFTVIGHEPQLNHVLKYLELKAKDYVITNGFLYTRDFQYGRNGIKLNLDSNLLKDQPKELIEWLDKIE